MIRVRRDPLAGRRARAYLRDAAGYLGIAAAMVPAGIVISRAVTDPDAARAVATAASFVAPVAATMWATRAESGPHAATWGKRREGLRVVGPHGESPGLGTAILRNTVKIALPWQLGHMVALGAAFGDFETAAPLTIASTVLTYVLVPVMIALVVLSPGRGLADRCTATRVITEGDPPSRS